MGAAGYLLQTDEGEINDFNAAVMAKAGVGFGMAVRPTSLRRGYVSVEAYKRLRATLGQKRFDTLARASKVSILKTLDEDEALALIETRDPADLGDPPPTEQPPQANPDTGDRLDWHLVETELCRAWSLLGGAGGIDWGEVAVGHIDTGFTANPALGFPKGEAGSPWIDTARDRNFFEKEMNPPEGMPTFAQFDSAEDSLGGFSGGHGTRTMSVLCGYDTSAAAKTGGYAGYFGAAPQVPVVPIRLEDTIWIQAALYSSLPAAIDYLVNSAAVSVITMSFGTPKYRLATQSVPESLRDAIDNAYERGVIFCCAAGNHVPDEHVVFPARCPRTIAVAGSAPGRMPWTGSSYGIQVDISAPGFPIRRADTKRRTGPVYGVGDGTSFATPQVAATAAMWLVHRRVEIDAMYTQPWQRVAAFRQLLVHTATPGVDWNPAYGAGILNARALLEAPLPDPASLVRDESQNWK